MIVFLYSKFQISSQIFNFEYDLNEIQETLPSQLLSRRALIPFPFHVEEKSQRDVNCQLHVCDDIYIMMQCLCVCVSRKMITSSWESPVTT